MSELSHLSEGIAAAAVADVKDGEDFEVDTPLDALGAVSPRSISSQGSPPMLPSAASASVAPHTQRAARAICCFAFSSLAT